MMAERLELVSSESESSVRLLEVLVLNQREMVPLPRSWRSGMARSASICWEEPLKSNAPAETPATRDGPPMMVPWWPFPEESVAVVPAESSSFHQVAR